MLHADFDEVMPDVIKRAFGGTYGWLAQECLGRSATGLSSTSDLSRFNMYSKLARADAIKLIE